MRTLPLFLELSGFRSVHDCWDDTVIAEVVTLAADGVLSEAEIAQAAEHDPLRRLLEAVTKGPEVLLPKGHSFRDNDGTERREVRIKWWKSRPSSWGDPAMSVPDPRELPATAPTAAVLAATYSEDAEPVFFGHYWMTGTPILQAPNAVCLDYSAGKDGPLVAYRLEDVAAPLSPAQIVGVATKRALRSAGGTVS